MNYYRRYVGDYMRKTTALSLAEQGAYNVLLDTYYANEQPLPASIDALARMCRATSKAERDAVRSVAEAFFPMGEDGLRHNKRADEEIAKAQSVISAQRASGKVSAAKRWGPKGSSGGASSAFDGGWNDGSEGGLTDGLTHELTDKNTYTGTDRFAIQPPTTKKKTTSKDLSGSPDEFDLFWAAYPRKEAKAKAKPAFAKQRASRDLPAILADLRGRSDEWRDRQFIPLPASYLNARRWEDERELALAGAEFGGGAL